MTRDQEDALFGDDALVEPFRVTPGFLAFVGLACLPAVIAVAVFFGAWMVASDVEAAESQAAPGEAAQVEGWKSALVGLCPVH
jgi:hypothetical protein